MLRGRLPHAAKGFGGQYPPQWFDTKDSDPSMAIRRCLLVMKPEAKVSIINCMHWMPVGIERGARFRNPENIPYILSRAFELNKVYEATGAALLTPRDLDIPSIRVYIKVVKPDLQPIHKIKLDQADIWIVEIKGQHYGRIVRELKFQDVSKPCLRAAFAQILPLFRLMLQLWGTLEVYVGPDNLTELQALENGPGLKVPGNIWYSFSREDCFISRKRQIPGDTTERMDFGGLVPHEQKVLPLGRDAIDILSHHFTSLSAFPQKSVPEKFLGIDQPAWIPMTVEYSI
ncbi:hypothetical protein M413DRAFT_30486 [Hebeloma cylindrosporum]|uniref:Uncharacterized protein n=1 Tax=Hebeloma cylindrosporum TaxID=76867 RepID=A0A0C2XK14_HEBCY|nr:hypothetical protein M413DRAFT_30486 [Hebeloma cylindrosporum h7]